jgi:hypothetical protein
VAETITLLTSTTTTLAVSPNPANSGDTVTFTATIAPAPTGSSLGTVTFFNSTTQLGTGNVNASGVATFTSGTLPDGTLSLAADYSGNATFAASNSAAVSEVLNPAFAVMAPQTPVPVPQGGSVGVAITLPPLGGAFNSPVTMSASGLPPGATATFNPPVVIPGASGIQTMMTVQLATLTSSFAGSGVGAIAGFILLLIFVPRGWRKTSRLRFALPALLLFVLCGGAALLTGCSGGFGAPALTAQKTFLITVTGTSGSLHASTTVTLTVQ